MQVSCYELDTVDDRKLKFAVIMARYKEQWIYVKHKERDTWECPGGKREENETIEETAKRELVEETGAQAFDLRPLCIYSVKRDHGEESYGALYYSNVTDIGCLSPESEIGQVSFMNELPNKLTYPEILPELYNKALQGMRMKV
ncbi:NUDIX hydrolase [Paenibacillus marinisediminis]